MYSFILLLLQGIRRHNGVIQWSYTMALHNGVMQVSRILENTLSNAKHAWHTVLLTPPGGGRIAAQKGGKASTSSLSVL